MHCFTTMVEGQEGDIGGEHTLPAKDQDQKIMVMGEKTSIHMQLAPQVTYGDIPPDPL